MLWPTATLQEVAIGTILFLLWAISYPAKAGGAENSPNALTIQEYFPFIVNAPLGGLALVSPMKDMGEYYKCGNLSGHWQWCDL